MKIVGIDVGVYGALAFLDTEDARSIEIVDMPVLAVKRGKGTKPHVNAVLLAQELRVREVDEAWVEITGARPGQGVTSMFSFGRSTGIAEGVLAGLGVRTTTITPQKWKKALSVPEGKDGARARASALFPWAVAAFARVKDHGRADAALIALFGARERERPNG